MADDVPHDAPQDEATGDGHAPSGDQRADASAGADDTTSIPSPEGTAAADGTPESEFDQLFDVPDIVVSQYVPDHPLQAPVRHRRVRAGVVVGLTAAAGAVWVGAVATFSPSARHEISQVVRTVPGGDKLVPAAAPQPRTSSPSPSAAHSSASASSGSVAPSIGGLDISGALQPALFQAGATSSSYARTDVRHRPSPDTKSSPGHGGVTVRGGGVPVSGSGPTTPGGGTTSGGGTTPGGGTTSGGGTTPTGGPPTPPPPPPVVTTGSPGPSQPSHWGTNPSNPPPASTTTAPVPSASQSVVDTADPSASQSVVDTPDSSAAQSVLDTPDSSAAQSVVDTPDPEPSPSVSP